MKLDPKQVETLLASTLATRPREIDCDEWLASAARYAELSKSGTEIPEDLELMAQHLEVCPECREEFETLVALLGG